MQEQNVQTIQYVGTIVGESTSKEFRLAVTPETIREQDIIAVNTTLKAFDDSVESIRVWAKVQRIERINPLFPSEAGHELAVTQTDPLDTVLSLSRDMVTAVCQVLGSEPINNANGKLDQLRYPAKPASSAYRPQQDQVKRIVLGELQGDSRKALDIAWLANRREIDLAVDGHAVLSRHLAILAMTGAGKSWTATRLIEQIAEKNYPIIIFDPHGEYGHLSESLGSKVQQYYPEFPLFDEPVDKVLILLESLAWNLSKTQKSFFADIFEGSKKFIEFEKSKKDLDKEDFGRYDLDGVIKDRTTWLSDFLGNSNIRKFGIKPDFFLIANLVEAYIKARKDEDNEALKMLEEWTDVKPISKLEATWFSGMVKCLRQAGKEIYQMQKISKEISLNAQPLPKNRLDLVNYGQISIVSLSGYSDSLKATIYSMIVQDIFDARVNHKLDYPVYLVLEEAHNFSPANTQDSAIIRSTSITRKVAQEGRKFGVGLMLISQRPSRLDETTLSQCNSFIVMRMVNPADQNFVKKVIESLGEDDVKLLPDLDKGEAILSGQFISFPVLAKIKPPKVQYTTQTDNLFEQLESAHQKKSKEKQKGEKISKRSKGSL